MEGLRVKSCILVLLAILHCHCCSADGGRYLADEDYTYRLLFPNGSNCMTISLNAQLVIYYRSFINATDLEVENEEFQLPTKNETTSTHECTDDVRTLSLSWVQDVSTFNLSLAFNVNKKEKEWHLGRVDVDFDLDNGTFLNPEVTGFQSYQTTPGVSLFNRTFGIDNYFHCKACKRMWLSVDNNNASDNITGPCYLQLDKDGNNFTSCSHLFLSNSVIFPGKLDNNTLVKKKLCLEDLIDLQEVIIPAVVGGVLGVLLLVIFLTYLVAFLRRKRREGQYETINDVY